MNKNVVVRHSNWNYWCDNIHMDHRNRMQYFRRYIMKAETIEDVLSIIDKHYKIHEKGLMRATLKDDKKDRLEHSSAMATLTMLTMEIKGVKKW